MSRLLTATISAAIMIAIDLAAHADPWEMVWLGVSFATGFVTCAALLEDEEEGR